MPDRIQDRRRFQRIPFEADVELLEGPRRWSVQLHDLSLKGLLVDRPAGWQAPVGALIQANLRLASDVEMRMLVSLAHEDDGLLGFYCREIDLDSLTHLRRLIELNLGDSELLERELSALIRG